MASNPRNKSESVLMIFPAQRTFFEADLTSVIVGMLAPNSLY